MTVKKRYETDFNMNLIEFFIKFPIADLKYKTRGSELLICSDHDVARIESIPDGWVVGVYDKAYERLITERVIAYDRKTQLIERLVISCHYPR